MWTFALARPGSAPELPICALTARNECAHRTSADEGFPARPIGTSGARTDFGRGRRESSLVQLGSWRGRPAEHLLAAGRDDSSAL
jgi:hypothetical protein